MSCSNTTTATTTNTTTTSSTTTTTTTTTTADFFVHYIQFNAVIEQGPPDTIPARFTEYFWEKDTKTNLAAKEAMLALGWVGKFQ